jgi:hypothetical protein
MGILKRVEHRRMAEFYNKECPFEGSQKPIPRAHLRSRFSIPEKCDGCQFYFEGGCKKIANRRVRLDYGFCGIEGSKELVDDPRAKRRIPLKCVSCPFLKTVEIYGLVCTKDPDLWGDIPRGLDY